MVGIGQSPEYRAVEDFVGKRAFVLLLAVIIPAATAVASTPKDDKRPLAVVPSVDLLRYTGTWYEIARYPNRFQKKCAGDVTAKYTILDDGKIRVENQCTEFSGKVNVAKGKAKIVDKTTNAKLKVTFFWPFYGDYWIIDLGPNYEYAVVGEPGRKFLWILSRTPSLDPATYQSILDRLPAAGYDPARLVKTEQKAST